MKRLISIAVVCMLCGPTFVSKASGMLAGSPQQSAADSQQTDASKASTADSVPPGEGIYYQGPNGWVKLESITMSGGGAKKVGKLFVPGLTPQMVWTFRGAAAPVRITNARPTFYIRQSPLLGNIPGQSARDVIIVKFDEKKDHRELQTTSGSSAFTFKAGFSKERTPDIVVKELSTGLISIVPAQDLRKGEYLLTFGAYGASGYDFGIVEQKK